MQLNLKINLFQVSLEPQWLNTSKSLADGWYMPLGKSLNWIIKDLHHPQVGIIFSNDPWLWSYVYGENHRNLAPEETGRKASILWKKWK